MAQFRPKQLAHLDPKSVAQIRPFYPNSSGEINWSPIATCQSKLITIKSAGGISERTQGMAKDTTWVLLNDMAEEVQ